MDVVSARYPAVELKDLDQIRRFVEITAAAFGGDQDAVSEVVLAVNEAVANVIVHGYQHQPGYLLIEVARIGDGLRIVLRDRAPCFDPTRVPTPDVNVPLGQRPYGGMGVHMIRSFTDELSYRVTAEGENELVLERRDVLRSS